MEQLNKLQLKAEILTVIAKLQADMEAVNVEECMQTLIQQEDKTSIAEILSKELARANEQKAVVICFLFMKLCDKEILEEHLWAILKKSGVADTTKAVVLNILKEMGHLVDYEKLDEYFENPELVVDEDTKMLLQQAILNPEAQIDFLDFLASLSDSDKKVLINSLGDDYTSDDLANILNPVVLNNPTTQIAHTAIEVLGNSKSQLAFYGLQEALSFVDDEVTKALIKKSLSTLKIAGIREENAIEFYKSILSSMPYESYTSFPDGHGNQAIIFSREKVDETIQFVALVINDVRGIIDCFGFNEISKTELERIVDKFYGMDERIYLDPYVTKKLLLKAEALSRKNSLEISYEYMCWKNLFADIEVEPATIDIIMECNYDKAKKLSDEELETVFMMDFIQKWFFDSSDNENFAQITIDLNERIKNNDYDFDLEDIVKRTTKHVIEKEQQDLYGSRLLTSAYLKHLQGKKREAQLLYSLYYDEDKRYKLAENIFRKSIYEYYVSLKFKLLDENRTSNIFSMRNKKKIIDLIEVQIEKMIKKIEAQWVNG